MDTTISRILGEDGEPVPIPGRDDLEDEKAPVSPPETQVIGPEEAEIDELSNLWQSGNKSEVIHRYLEMNNETSVKLVFAIGLEGSLELARMVDQMIEQEEMQNGDSVEPQKIEQSAAKGPDSLVGDILGHDPEQAAETAPA